MIIDRKVEENTQISVMADHVRSPSRVVLFIYIPQTESDTVAEQSGCHGALASGP